MIKYFGPCKFFIPKTDKQDNLLANRKGLSQERGLTFFKTFFCNTIKQINIMYSIKGSLPIEGL